MTVRRGEIYYADLDPVVGSEQSGVRPVLILQNDTGNLHSLTTIVAALTGNTGKARLPTHCRVGVRTGLPRASVVLLEQIRTLDKRRLREYVGVLSEGDMRRVDAALAASVGLNIHGEEGKHGEDYLP